MRSVSGLLAVTFVVALFCGLARVHVLLLPVAPMCVGAYYAWRSAGKQQSINESEWDGARSSALSALALTGFAVAVGTLDGSLRMGGITYLFAAVVIFIASAALGGATVGIIAHVAWRLIFGGTADD